MKPLLYLTVTLVLWTISSLGQIFPPPRSAPAGLTITERILNPRTVTNLLAAYDAGDAYLGASGRRSLLRLPGAIAVRVENRAALPALTATGGALEGYATAAQGNGGFAWLRDRSPQAAATPALLTEKIKATRQKPGLLLANPVFVEPESGLWAMTTDEIIIALKPGVDAQAYFGADWVNARPLFAPLGQYLFTLAKAESESVLAEVNRRAADSRVAWAEPNFISQGLTQLLPNDPEFANQWHLRNTGQSGGTVGADVKATAAWESYDGQQPRIIVAVMDVGFDLAHPDLIANIATNTMETPGNGVDDDGNGLIDDVRGWDYFDSDNNPSPDNAFDNHGTPVAGAAVAAGHNGVGVTGMAYGCRLLPLRIGESDSGGSFSSRDSDLANAVYYCAGGFNPSDSWRGVDVIAMSFESFQSAIMDSAITFATEQGRGGRGCAIFVAMGNHGDNWRGLNLSGFSAGTYTFEWKYSKNASGAAGEDAVWMAKVLFPGGVEENFDGATFPPAGWTTSGNANWTRASDPAHAYGASLFTARSGVIADNQSTSLLRTRAINAGTVTYYYWVSSEQNLDIFSISINGGVQSGANQSGVPFIRAGPSYPGTHTNVITIGASTHWDTRAGYSQIGGKIDVLAPGGAGGGASFLTTDRTGTNGDNTAVSPAGDYQSSQGTSLANPLAAGVGALMLSVAPNLTAIQVRDILRSTADKVGPVPYTNGWNPYYGAGRVNASNAVGTAWASSCLGLPILVTSLADAGPGTLREAIERLNAAGCSGTISLSVTGVINLASSLPALIPSAILTGPGTNQLTINGGGASALFAFGPGSTNKLSGLRLANAFSINAGASVANLGRTVIENCAFSNSVTMQHVGGAVANLSGTGWLFVTNCVFANNTARGGAGEDRGPGRNGGPGGGGAGLGGALYSEGPQLALHGCAFAGNTAAGGNGGMGDGNTFSNDTGGNGGFPNRGLGGAVGQPGGAGGFGGGGGGGAGSATAGFDGGAGGYGGGGGGGGARGGGGNGGVGGNAGPFGGIGGVAFASHSGGGGAGAGLGGAVFIRSGVATLVSCSFTGNRATNGVGGVGSFGGGNGGNGQGAGGAVFNLDAKITAQNLTFSGNSATTSSPDVEASTVVTTLADDGSGSLRQAICNAAIRPGADLITFATNLSGGVIRLTTAQLLITNLAGPLTITASNLPGGLAISGEGARRAFSITAGNSLTLDSLTLSNCTAAGQGSGEGGALHNQGTLSLRRCVLRNNTAPGGNGGGVKNTSSMAVNECTFFGNATRFAGGAVDSSGAATFSNSTFTGNTATNNDGGAVQIATGVPFGFSHCTVAGNSAGGAGGGLRISTTQATFSHSIVAGNSAPSGPDINKTGAYIAGVFNVVGNGTSSQLTDGSNGNQVGTAGLPLNPLLSPLQNHGGPTPTMLPLPGSPAIDAGDPTFFGAGLTDQRGWPRVWAGRVDIGAVEFAPVAGYSVVFDGVNDFLILSNAALSLPTNEITVEFWERVETVRDQFSFILFPDMPANRLSFSSVRLGLGTYWDFGDLFNGGRVVYGTPPGTIGQWTHWALVSTRAGNAMSVYRNGKLDVSSATNRTFVRYAAALVLGARLDIGGQEYYKGEIDEFRLWSVARTPAEIQSGMNAGLCPPYTNLWVYWKFNEPSGATVLDDSGNGRNGLLFNGATRTNSFAPLRPAGAATIARLGPTQIRVTWNPNSGCLQSAPEATGPWTIILGATNGQVLVTSPARQFFRVTP